MPTPHLNARLQVFGAAAGGSSDFQITGQFADESSDFFPSDVVAGTEYFDFLGRKYTVVLNTTGPATIMTIDVSDDESAGVPSTGAGILSEATPIKDYSIPARQSSGVTEYLQQLVRSNSIFQIDNCVTVDDASDTVVTETTYGQTDTAGTATDYSRADHTHGSPDAQTSAEVSYDNTSSGLAATDAQAAIDELDTALDGISVPTAANAVVAETAYGNTPSVGTITTEFAREDHTHGTPDVQTSAETSYDNTASGLSATDAQGAIDELDTTIDGLNVPTPANAIVTETAYGQTSTQGVNTTEFAREDHTHGTPDAQDASEVSYDNTASGLSATDTQGAIDELDTAIDGISVPTAATTVVTETAFGQASIVGTATEFAREDHTHGTPADPGTAPTPANSVVSETAFGNSTSVGTNTTEFAREDHTHGTPVAPVTTLQEITVGQGDITGDLTLTAGSNVTLTQVGNTVDIAAVAGGAGNTYYDLGSGCYVKASAGTPTFTKSAGIGTLAIPSGVIVDYIRITGTSAELTGANTFVVRIKYPPYNTVDNPGSISDVIFPIINIIDSSTRTFGGPSAGAYGYRAFGAGGVAPSITAFDFPNNGVDVTVSALNAFLDWTLVISL